MDTALDGTSAAEGAAVAELHATSEGVAADPDGGGVSVPPGRLTPQPWSLPALAGLLEGPALLAPPDARRPLAPQVQPGMPIAPRPSTGPAFPAPLVPGPVTLAPATPKPATPKPATPEAPVVDDPRPKPKPRARRRAVPPTKSIRTRHGVPGMPKRGELVLGVNGGVTAFSKLTRAPHKMNMQFITWGEGVPGGHGKKLARRYATAKRDKNLLALHIGTGRRGREVISPRAIARGHGDRWLVAASKQVNEANQQTYIRPMAEMNGHWTPYSAFTKGGKPKPNHRTADYRQAFRRIAIVMDGGSVKHINEKLRAAGMPKLDTKERTIPRSGKVAMVWNPQGAGSPAVPGNSPAAYYPGDKYVDIVANDIYSTGNDQAYWAGMEPLYHFRKKKPFMVAEWGTFGKSKDDAAFVKHMFEWAKEHPRTMGLVWFELHEGRGTNISDKSRQLATYRRYAKRVAAD